MIVASHYIINTPLQWGVLRGAETKNCFNFNSFYALSKTAEAVKTSPPHSDTLLKQGVNETNPFRIARFVKHSDWSEKRGIDAGSLENDKRRSASVCLSGRFRLRASDADSRTALVARKWIKGDISHSHLRTLNFEL